VLGRFKNLSKYLTYFEILVFIAALLFGTYFLLKYNDKVYEAQQFVDLAHSFNQGKLYFLKEGFIYDAAIYEGRSYWPLGPMPAVILMPFVYANGTSVQQGQLQLLAIIIIFFLSYKISRKLTGNALLSMWLAFGYIFATAFIGIATWPISWEFGQVIGNLFLILCVYEFVYKKRWWLIGFYLGFGFLTRSDIVVAGLFFALSILFGAGKREEKVSNLVNFLIPVVVCLVMFSLYNYYRFGSFLETGYGLQVLVEPTLIAQRSYGIWSTEHFLSNLYYLFLKGPDGIFIPGTMMMTSPYISANVWGMSIFLTSPIFLWLIKAPFKNKNVIFCLISVVVMLFMILGYYGIGVIQYGYRYAIDFYPLLFYMLAMGLAGSKSNALLKSVIVFSFLFNAYLVTVLHPL